MACLRPWIATKEFRRGHPSRPGSLDHEQAQGVLPAGHDKVSRRAEERSRPGIPLPHNLGVPDLDPYPFNHPLRTGSGVEVPDLAIDLIGLEIPVDRGFLLADLCGVGGPVRVLRDRIDLVESAERLDDRLRAEAGESFGQDARGITRADGELSLEEH